MALLHFEQDRPNVGAIVSITLIGTLVLYLFILVADVLYHVTSSQRAETMGGGMLERAQSFYAKQEEAFSDYRYIDKEKGKVALPIRRAMQLVLEEEK
ncbi:MAG TPA: hypothetical protein ENK02_13030 [Planctomycetes bacterium]|nr:hypothetical protein [Planctomycetota bacterium]